MRGSAAAKLVGLWLLGAASEPAELVAQRRGVVSLFEEGLRGGDAPSSSSSQRSTAKKKACDDEGASEKKRLGVCVTGQMSRLELESKVRHLARTEKYEVTFVLVLSNATSHFANNATDAGGRAAWTAQSIRRFVLPRVRVIVDEAPQEQRPFVWEDYLSRGDKKQRSVDARSRAESHVRQWVALLRCWVHFQQLPSFDALVKLRDDSLLLGPWRPDLAKKTEVVVQECFAYGGYADKVAVVGPGAARAYFAMPAVEYFTNYSSLDVRKGNPEHLLKRVLAKHRVAVRRVGPDLLPVATSRLTPLRKVCFPFDYLKLGKDPACYPSDCRVRSSVYCARCRESPNPDLRESYLSRGGAQPDCLPARRNCSSSSSSAAHHHHNTIVV